MRATVRPLAYSPRPTTRQPLMAHQAASGQALLALVTCLAFVLIVSLVAYLLAPLFA
jgi:hypothetical protein